MLDEGLKCAVDDIAPREIVLVHPKDTSAEGAAAPAGGAAGGEGGAEGKVLRFWLEDPRIGFPTHKGSASDARLFPWQCREMGTTYAAPLSATLCRRVENGAIDKVPVKLGDAPIMIRSNRCHLANLSPDELVKHNEEQVEAGGYFICNGIERIVRILQVGHSAVVSDSPPLHPATCLRLPACLRCAVGVFATVYRVLVPDTDVTLLRPLLAVVPCP
jgi:hypothetical protein